MSGVHGPLARACTAALLVVAVAGCGDDDARTDVASNAAVDDTDGGSTTAQDESEAFPEARDMIATFLQVDPGDIDVWSGGVDDVEFGLDGDPVSIADSVAEQLSARGATTVRQSRPRSEYVSFATADFEGYVGLSTGDSASRFHVHEPGPPEGFPEDFPLPEPAILAEPRGASPEFVLDFDLLEEASLDTYPEAFDGSPYSLSGPGEEDIDGGSVLTYDVEGQGWEGRIELVRFGEIAGVGVRLDESR